MNYHDYVSNRLQPLLNGVLKDFTSQASQMYKEADEHARSQYTTLIGKNAQSYDRHWTTNERLHDLAQNYDDVKVDILGNGKNSYYTILQQNDVIVTVSQVSTSGIMVRDSKFRNKLASQFGATLSLFEPEPTFTLPKNKLIYAVILHGAISKKDSNLGFVNIATPDVDFQHYPYNECLFKLCGLKHPYMISEPVVEKIEQTGTVELIRKPGNK